MHQLAQQLIIGLSVGATYALIALGYTMVYGVLRLINFAHGDVYMVGAVSGFYLSGIVVQQGWPLWIGLPMVLIGSMVVCSVVGFLIEFLAYRPLRERPRLVVLITAIGVSLLLENMAQLRGIFGPDPKRYPPLLPASTLFTFQLGGGMVSVTNLDVLSLSLSVSLMVVLWWVVTRTRTGLALRAVSYRFDTAMLMGVNTNRIISFTFMLGSALAAVAGVFDAMRYDVRPLMGVLPGIKAFVAAVLGGIGSIPGALAGGLLIGLIETLVKAYISSAYADAVAFIVLILILLVRPTGLFGRTVTEKV